jgi:hypothetical protein
MPKLNLCSLLEAFAVAASPEYAREFASRSTSGAKAALTEAGENLFPDGNESRATNRKNSSGSEAGGANQGNREGARDRIPGSVAACLSDGPVRS